MFKRLGQNKNHPNLPALAASASASASASAASVALAQAFQQSTWLHYCPFLCQVLARALALQQGREGSSAVLLEDPDTVSVLELYGQMVARLLEGSNKFLFIYLAHILFLSVFLASIPVDRVCK